MNPPLYRAKRLDNGEVVEGYYERDEKSYPRHGINSPGVHGINHYFGIDPSTLEIQTSSGEFKPIDKTRIE